MRILVMGKPQVGSFKVLPPTTRKTGLLVVERIAQPVEIKAK